MFYRRTCHSRRRNILLAGLGLLGTGLFFSTCIKAQDSAWTGPVPARAPVVPEDSRRHLPVSFTVKEYAGVDRPRGLVEAGVPLARGETKDARSLRVTYRGKAVPASFAPLAWWSDGSVRWAKMIMPVRLRASASKTFEIARGEGLSFKFKQPETPPLTLRLKTDAGADEFPIGSSLRKTRGDHLFEVDIEPLTAERIRVRVHAVELRRDAFWKSLTLELSSKGSAQAQPKLGAGRCGQWAAVIRQAAERGPKDVKARAGKLLLHLYPPNAPPFPADRGFHVTHEIILEKNASPADLARRIAAPLRVSWPPAYFNATRAMGRSGVLNAHSRALDGSFLKSWKSLGRQQNLPRNRGWTAWGDFFDRNQGPAYSGFLNQEYDPATSFFIYHARSGDIDALNTALDMARQYADNCVSLKGGCYQHRATLHALEGHIAKALGQVIRRKWRKRPGLPLSDGKVLAYVEKNYGAKAARAVARLQEGISLRDRAERERLLSEQIAFGLVRDAEQQARTDTSLQAQLRRKYGKRSDREPLFRETAEYFIRSKDINPFGLPTVDKVFAPFFTRYGGSWDDFPVFHFYDLPVDESSHEGGHSLGEMLVWGYLLTGDVSLRRAALRVARYHVAGGLVERGIKSVKGELAGGRLTFARAVGWPLVNLLALEVLTEGSERALDAKVKKAIRKLVDFIMAIPPERYQGTIHVGVVSEGLARYHERTGDRRARKYLIRLSRYWAATQWNSRLQGFHYMKDQSKPVWSELSGFYLYGLAYAAWQSGDERLADRARRTLARMCRKHPDYVKSFAMKFHNSQRALALWPLLP